MVTQLALIVLTIALAGVGVALAPSHRRTLAVVVAVLLVGVSTTSVAFAGFTASPNGHAAPSPTLPFAAYSIGTTTMVTCQWISDAHTPSQSITLNWTSSSSNWSTTQVQRSTGGAFSNLGTASAPNTTYTDATATSATSTTYSYRANQMSGSFWTGSTSSTVTSTSCKDAIGQLVSGALSSKLSGPFDMAMDSAGNIFIADTGNGLIREITASDGKINTVAGNASGVTTDNQPATSTKLNNPKGIAVSGSTIYVADTGDNTVRKFTVGGNMNIVAGTSGSSGNVGEGLQANTNNGTVKLNAPQDVAVDSSGNVFIADTGSDTVREVAGVSTNQFAVGAMTAGDIYRIGGTFGSTGSTGDGASALSAKLSGSVSGITTDSSGNVIIADKGNNKIRAIAAAASQSLWGTSITNKGDVQTIAGGGADFATTQGDLPTSASFSSPYNIDIDASGDLLIADNADNVVRFIANSASTLGVTGMTANRVYTLAGNGTTVYTGDGYPDNPKNANSTTAESITGPQGIVHDPTNSAIVYVVDNSKNNIRRIDTTNHLVFTWAGQTASGSTGDGSAAHGWELNTPYHTALDSSGNLYIADPADNRIREYVVSCPCVKTYAGTGASLSNGDGGSPLLANLNAPDGVYVDSSNNVYIAETGANKIRMIPASNMTRFGVVMTAGNIYTIVNSAGSVCGAGSAPCGDGSQVNNVAVRLNAPRDVHVDSSGNLFISDSGDCEIRYVPIGTTAAYGLNSGGALTANQVYNLGGTQLSCTTSSTTLNVPDGITLDAGGNVYIAEASGHKIHKIAASNGALSDYAGTGSAGSTNSTLTASTFNGPLDISYDSTTGDFFVADSGNNKIRKLSGNNVTTVAGGGTLNPGNGGYANDGQLTTPGGVSAKGGGNVYITQDSATADLRTLYGPDP